MARIIGCVTTSHVPAIGNAIARGRQEEPYWKEWFDGFTPVHRWLDRVRPDVAVVVYNDHGLNFFLDKLPTFAIGAAAEYQTADEGWNLPAVRPFPGDPALSWHVINSVVAAGFDVTMCQEMAVDHAVCNPMQLLWPGGGPWPVRIVPVEINTVQFPLPSAARCWEFGQAIGRAVASYPSWATRYSTVELVEQTGSQGIELILWLTARAVLGAGSGGGDVGVREVAATYHVPISNTAAGMMLLEPAG
jgi:protocatechuate 4,5-dioxygenase, beta chain